MCSLKRKYPCYNIKRGRFRWIQFRSSLRNSINDEHIIIHEFDVFFFSLRSLGSLRSTRERYLLLVYSQSIPKGSLTLARGLEATLFPYFFWRNIWGLIMPRRALEVSELFLISVSIFPSLLSQFSYPRVRTIKIGQSQKPRIKNDFKRQKSIPVSTCFIREQ